MSLQERTLVVKNFDPEKTSQKLLKELCLQAGPVRNVVVRQDHAFVEFEDVESVGFAKALLDGVILHKKKLYMEPKLRTAHYYKYTRLLQDYIKYDKQQRAQQATLQAFQTVNGLPQTPTVVVPATSAAFYPYPNQQMITAQPTQVYANQLLQQMPAVQNTSPWVQQMQPQMIPVNGLVHAPNYVAPVAVTTNYTHNNNRPMTHQINSFQEARNQSHWSTRRR